MKIFIFLTIMISFNFAGSFPSLLFHGNCITCHQIDNDKSAPSIKKVKSVYMNVYPKKEDFVKQMSIWVLNPNAKTSIMLDAIEKYELMPHLAYDKQTLEEIASYIYKTDFK